MRITRFCVFTFSILLFNIGFGQDKDVKNEVKKEEKKEEVKPKYPVRYGVRVGADISRLVRSALDKNYKGLELVGDYRLSKRLYVAGEIGKEKRSEDTQYFSYTSNGHYIKGGVDYNVFNNWYGMDNMIYVGGRYGISNFKQKMDSYTIHTTENYWDEDINGMDTEMMNEGDGRWVHWVEFLVGVKAELLKNFYVGGTVRLGKIVYQSKRDFPTYWAPGFNRVWEGSGYGIGYNYSITYMVPFVKK